MSVAGHPELLGLASKYGYGLLQKSDPRKVAYLSSFWTATKIASGKNDRMTSGDGGVDSHGRLWVGTVQWDTNMDLATMKPVGMFGLEHEETLSFQEWGLIH